MIPYQIRSVQLINLVRDIKNGNLISDAYFQRNLVWRDTHKKDLIKTIIDGFPFPLIFISKGKINVEEMSSISCIVDGQQRCNAITSFINNDFDIDGSYFRDFSEEEKSEFFKYEIPVCELDLLNDDDRVKDIFKRINRTSNSLTAIEKQASEYGASYYMLFAKLLALQIDISKDDTDDENFRLDPNIPEDFINWAREVEISSYNKLITDSRIFTARDLSRKVNLQYTLNLVTTYLAGFYNRNDKVSDYLNNYVDEFDNKDTVLEKFEFTADYYLSLSLPDDSIWFNKANFFSLFIAFLNKDIEFLRENKVKIFERLLSFKELPGYEEYQIFAKEGVNNKKERTSRNEYIEIYIFDKQE